MKIMSKTKKQKTFDEDEHFVISILEKFIDLILFIEKYQIYLLEIMFSDYPYKIEKKNSFLILNHYRYG